MRSRDRIVEDVSAINYGLQAIDGYMPFNGALEYILNQMKESRLWYPWLPDLFVFHSSK